MIPVSPARRRAEAFAAQVDDRGAARDGRDADLLALVADLRSTPPATPRPEFVTDLRSRLMAEADLALAEVDPRLTLPAHTRTRRDRRIAVAAGAAALVGATSSMAVAAQSALPGDALYPIKRVLESATATLQVNDVARADQLLANASDRLAEVAALAQLDADGNGTAIAETLDDFSSQATEAADLMLDEYADTGDRAGVEQLRSFTATSMDTLAQLDPIVPESAREALNHAALVISEIDRRAGAACPTCGGALVQVPDSLLVSFRPSDSGANQIAPMTVLEPAEDTTYGEDDGSSSEEPLSLDVPEVPLNSNGQESSDSDGDTGGGTTEDPSEPLQDLTELLVSGGEVEESGDGLLDPLLRPLGETVDDTLDDDGLLGGG